MPQVDGFQRQFAQPCLRRVVALLFGLPQNILDAFAGGRDGREIFRSAHGDERLGAGHGIAHVVGACGQHGIDHVVSEAAHIFEIEVQALAEEGDHLLLVRALDAGGGKHIGERQRQARLGEDLHDGVGRAAQGERIFRTGGRVADAEHGGDCLNAIGDAE